MKKMTDDVKQYLTERAWYRLRPGDLAKSISIEAAELLEIFQWDNPNIDAVLADEERKSRVQKELADILIYCFEVAALLDLDVESIMRAKLERIKEKYPADLFKDLDPETQGTHEVYWKIKNEHRRKGEQ